MKTIILAGGRGTRLSEETAIIPKPLVSVNGKPLINHIMEHYSKFGYDDFIVACGYKGEKLVEYFQTLKEHKWKVDLVDTGLDTPTGGRLKRLTKYVDGTFMMTYGDGISDLDISKLVQFHKKHGKLATLTAVRMPRFGILHLNGDLVTSFQEKRLEYSPYINGGFMVLEKGVLDYIEDDVAFETVPLQKLAEDNQLMAYKYEGFWKCVDNLRDKWDLEEYLKNHVI